MHGTMHKYLNKQWGYNISYFALLGCQRWLLPSNTLRWLIFWSSRFRRQVAWLFYIEQGTLCKKKWLRLHSIVIIYGHLFRWAFSRKRWRKKFAEYKQRLTRLYSLSWVSNNNEERNISHSLWAELTTNSQKIKYGNYLRRTVKTTNQSYPLGTSIINTYHGQTMRSNTLRKKKMRISIQRFFRKKVLTCDKNTTRLIRLSPWKL